MAEAYGWFLHRLGEDAARTFRLSLQALPKLEILALDSEHHTAVVRKLDRLRGYKLTYVDASSLVFLEVRQIRIVWGTDRHLPLEGASILPAASTV